MLVGKAALWEAGAGAVTWLSPPISSPSVQKLLDVYFSRILFLSWHLQSSEPAQQTSLGQEACCLQGAPQSSDFVGSVQWWELAGGTKCWASFISPWGSCIAEGIRSGRVTASTSCHVPCCCPRQLQPHFPRSPKLSPGQSA